MLGERLKAMVASHEIAMGESKAALKSPAILSVNLGMVVTLLSLTENRPTSLRKACWPKSL